MLQVKNLGYKYFRSAFRLKNITFSLEDGYLMCLIGKNGAGKTTLLREIYGVLEAATGTVTYNGMQVVAGKTKGEQGEDGTGCANKRVSSKDRAGYHREVAYVGAVTWFMTGLTMEENMETLQSLYPAFDRAEYDRLLTYFGLKQEDQKKTYGELSAGQKVLFQIAFAMARHPKLLLLDEPFANLDPVVKVDFSQLLQDKLEQENMQVIVSTHLVDDISDMVDYVGVLKDGEMVEFGDRETLFEGKGVEGLREFILKESSGKANSYIGGEK